MHAGTTSNRSHTATISRAYAILSGVLIFFAALLLAVMPVTERFWDFDHFLRGGQDFEFGFLALLVVLCLVLLLAQNANIECSLLLALRRWLRFIFPPAAGLDTVTTFHAVLEDQPISRLSIRLYTLPLQV